VLLRAAASAACLIAVSGCAPQSGPEWTFSTRRPMLLAGDSQALTPAVANDTVLFCGGYFWNGWSELHALAASTGQLRWHVPVGSCEQPPVVVGTTAIQLASQNHGAQYAAYGVDVASGGTRWTRDLGPLTFHAPLGGFLYVAAFKQPLRRVNAVTGDVESVELDNAPGNASNERVWIASTSVGLLIGSGTSLWRLADPAEKAARIATLQALVRDVESVAADDNLLVVQSRDNEITAFAVDDGRVLWNRRFVRVLGAPARLVDPIYGAPAAADGLVFVNTFGAARYELLALDGRTGNTVWSARDGSFNPPTGPPAGPAAEVFVTGRNALLIVDRRSGQITSRIPVAKEVTTSPSSYGDLLIFGTIDGALHAVRRTRPR